MSTGWFEDKTALLFFTLYIFLWNFSPKPRPREKEPSQSWPTKLGSPFIARVEFPGESLRQVLIYLPNCAVAMRKKFELRQHREHGRKQPKPIKIHQMGFKAYHFVFQCAIRSKSAEIPNVQKFLNCGGFRWIYLNHHFDMTCDWKWSPFPSWCGHCGREKLCYNRFRNGLFWSIAQTNLLGTLRHWNILWIVQNWNLVIQSDRSRQQGWIECTNIDVQYEAKLASFP